MQFGIKDILVFGILALTAGVLVNDQFELNIGFLNDVSDMVYSSSSVAPVSDYSSQYGADDDTMPAVRSPKCVEAHKIAGDAKSQMRSSLSQAESDNDLYKLRELEERLKSISDGVKKVCRE